MTAPTPDPDTESSDDPKRDPQVFVRALARGLSLIEALGGKIEGGSLSELALQCDLDRATARRLLMTLAELGYVRAAGNRYFLAPRALGLGYAYLSSIPFWEVATPIMEQLVREIHESCSAATLDGAHAVYVARVRSNERFVDVARTVGSSIPAYCTSLGRVMLSALAPAQQRAVLASLPLQQYTPYTVTDVDALCALLDGVKRQGWALVDQEMELGLRSIAVPLHAGDGRVFAALNVSVQADRVGVDELIANCLEPLRKAAAQLDEAARSRQGRKGPSS